MSFVFRIIGAILFGVGGRQLGLLIIERSPQIEELSLVIPLTVCSTILGFVFIPYPAQWLQNKIRQVPGHVLAAAVIGLVIALGVSALSALPLSLLPGLWGKFTPVVFCVIVIYLGVLIMVLRSHDIVRFLSSTFPMLAGLRGSNDDNVILDTNSIIDGRIADILQTGFVHGTLLIPKFVLDELQYIADSSDPLRRTRGRRGLDILTKLQRESDIPVQITDVDFEGVREVDAKLVELGKVMRCPIITNDVNLNRVATLQGVRVLNINELANAIKPVVLPNEDMKLKIVQEGKEHGQGIGYLDDGTMVVVEDGRRHLNHEITVTINRVLQTSAGRMIFAHPRS